MNIEMLTCELLTDHARYREKSPLARLLCDTAKGLRYSHLRLNDNTRRTLEASSYLYALIEILEENGLLSISNLEERKKNVAKRLVQKFKDSGIGLVFQDPEYDKYTFGQEANVDCLSRLPVCKAICCKFPFALSKQDVEEGIIRWDFERPYLIVHGQDGYCVHLDRESYQCTVRENRPVPCRGFDCSNDPKWPVWLDYKMQILDVEFVEKIDTETYAQ